MLSLSFPTTKRFSPPVPIPEYRLNMKQFQNEKHCQHHAEQLTHIFFRYLEFVTKLIRLINNSVQSPKPKLDRKILSGLV